MKKTIIVMPVANEEATMADVLDRILSFQWENLSVYPVLDAYSKDRTWEIVGAYEERGDGKVKRIFHERSTGMVSCYLYGFRRALEDGAERIIEMDGGGSHQPEDLPLFIEKLDAGYECVWGSRFMPGGAAENDPLRRRLLSLGGTVLSNLTLGTRLRDMTSGFEAFQRHVLERMNLDAFLSGGHMYQTEMKFYCRNYRYAEVPIRYIAGNSALKFKSVTEALRILFMLKKNEPKVMRSGGKGKAFEV